MVIRAKNGIIVPDCGAVIEKSPPWTCIFAGGIGTSDWILAGFVDAHSWTGYSHSANCGSPYGFVGGPLLGSPFFVQYNISCTPCEGSVFQIPRKTGGNESSSVSGAAGINGSAGYLPIAYAITSCHIGATMNAAIFFCMGLLSLFPAHAPMDMPGVYPTTHTSR